jgi:hypothetical protein
MKILEVGTDWDNLDWGNMSKAEFKRKELEWELRDEEDTVERGPFYVYSGKDSNSKRLIKARDGVPFRFSTKQAAYKAVDKMRAKPFNKGKEFWISTKMEEAGKYGNPEKGVQVRTTDKPKKNKPNTGNESPHPMRGKLVGEADEPTADKSARAKLDLNLRDRGHKVEPDKKKALKKGEVKHRKSLYQEMTDLEEGPLVISRSSDLMSMLDVLLKDFKSKRPSDEEVKALLKSLGYVMTKDGERTTLVKEAACPACAGRGHKPSSGDMDRPCDVCDGTGKQQIEEAPGAIRKGLAAVAIIASLWGVNNHMAQKAYDASPQLQKLTAYLEVAKQHNDQRMIDQIEQRIENHKLRLDLGKGDVMGKDGRPINVVYDKDVDEAKQRLDPKCWKGYKKQGTKMKGGVRVNNCVPK